MNREIRGLEVTGGQISNMKSVMDLWQEKEKTTRRARVDTVDRSARPLGGTNGCTDRANDGGRQGVLLRRR